MKNICDQKLSSNYLIRVFVVKIFDDKKNFVVKIINQGEYYGAKLVMANFEVQLFNDNFLWCKMYNSRNYFKKCLMVCFVVNKS